MGDLVEEETEYQGCATEQYLRKAGRSKTAETHHRV